MKDTLIKCLKAAGKIQKENIVSISNVSIKEKISSVVTEVDLLCEKEIFKILQQDYPDHNILSEEAGFVNKKSLFTWVVDPLDGTSNYAARLPWFGVLIGLFKDNSPIMGGAYLPVLEKLYFAEEGKGSFMNDQKINVKPKDLSNSLMGFSMDYTDHVGFLNKGVNIYKYLITNCRNVRSTNSLFDLMAVVENHYGGVVNLFNGVWDIAAPYLIIKEAGGVMKDLEGKEILFQLSESGLAKNYPVIAGAESVVEKVVNDLRVY